MTPNLEHRGTGCPTSALMRRMRWAFIYPAPGSEIDAYVEIVLLERHRPWGCAASHKLLFSLRRHGEAFVDR